MPVVVSLEKLYTLDEYDELVRDGARFELDEGKLEEMSPTKPWHGSTTARLNIYLGGYVLQNQLGETYIAEVGFILNRGADRLTIRAPDLAFLSTARVPHGQEQAEFVKGGPDLAVEVVSPSESRPKVRRKVRQYLNAGTQLVWVIRPESQTIEVYHPGDSEPKTLGPTDELDGENIVKGFKLKISQLFG